MNWSSIFESILAYGTTVLLALVVLIIGWQLINVFSRFFGKKLDKSEIDPSLHNILVSGARIVLQILLIVSVTSMIGIEMTSVIAVLAAASFAVGLALQGSLANFAGGILILFLKPFKLGDFIEAMGYSGTVAEIQLFQTILNTPDNKKVTLPNGVLSNEASVNYSANPIRRVDFSFGVGYQDDLNQAKEILSNIAAGNKLVFKDPTPQIVLGEHGDNAIIILMRVWCNTEDYWSIYFDILEKVKLEFDRAGINIPYPQVDVHLVKQS